MEKDNYKEYIIPGKAIVRIHGEFDMEEFKKAAICLVQDNEKEKRMKAKKRLTERQGENGCNNDGVEKP